MNQMTDTASAVNENRLIAGRREKLAALRAQGAAFPNDFRADSLSGDLQAEYADREAFPAATLEALARRVKLAGRMVLKRVQGKVSFVQLQDMRGRIQLFIHAGTVGDIYAAFRDWDMGDIVGAEGVLMRTRTGELSVRVDALRLLAKNLRPLPDKHHGMADVEQRYRQRHVDLIVNPEARTIFQQRSHIISFIRQYLEASPRHFMEVETPMMHVIPGGATARPFITRHNALDIDLYLRVAPELYLKRLVVGGFERVYEINRNFRNEGVSTRHNPEFTMLELYQAYATYDDMMDLAETLVRETARKVLGTTRVDWDGNVINLEPAFVRWTMADAVLEHNPSIGRGELRDRGALAAHARELGVVSRDSDDWGRLLLEIFERTVEPHLVQPTFITRYPLEVSPLARESDSEPGFADRFELFAGGREIANGFSELNDPEDQAARFRAQMAASRAGDDEAMRYDADYIRALEVGLPPTGGLGMGIDRLVMLLTGAPSIRDVLLFPAMRPEKSGQARQNSGKVP